MLRHCIMQMQRQTRPIDHAIYINSPDIQTPNGLSLRYGILLDDLRADAAGRIKIGYGPSLTSHGNYLSAIRLANVEDYDLFLKVDDDDVYLRDYAESVARDFMRRKWDYSGAASCGLLKGHRWKPKTMLRHIGLAQEDYDLGVPEVMPSSTAFSRRAIRAVLELPDKQDFEDVLWRRHLAKTPGMVLSTRKDKSFIYNFHGENVSMGSWLGD